MTPTHRDALVLACKVLDYAAEVADEPEWMRTCEEAADALRAALTEPPHRAPLTEEIVASNGRSDERMKFKTRNYSGIRNVPADELVERILDYESTLTRGEIETLRKNVETLTRMIQFIVNQMPSQGVIDFASWHGFDLVEENDDT